MSIHYQDGSVTLHQGDCIEAMRLLPDASVDAVVTDPPYGLEFMGKEWDGADGFRRSLNPADVGRDNAFGRTSKTSPEYRTASKATATRRQEGGISQATGPSFLGGLNPKCLVCDHWQRGSNPCKCEAPEWTQERLVRLHSFQEWCEVWSRECLRVLRPGGHMLAFGGTRTWHRLAVAIEDAGFEVRDSIAWLYGSGFPKSLRVSRDARYCHCDASVHTSSGTSPAPTPDDHTRTEDAEAATEGATQSAPRATREPLGSPAGCRPELGSGDALPHLAAASDLASALPLGCAPTHSRFAELAGGRGAGSSHTPSPAPRSGHPSNQDSGRPSHSPSDGRTHTQANTSPADTSESAHRTQDSPLDSSRLYGTGFPRCTTCDKPQADGLGTALKPAFEPIVVARKPLAGTVAANVLAHGTGALNVDGCRVGTADGDDALRSRVGGFSDSPVYGRGETRIFQSAAGRWPANVILDESQAAALDQMSGELASQKTRTDPAAPSADTDSHLGAMHRNGRSAEFLGETGGASRFFYVADHEPGELADECPDCEWETHHELDRPFVPFDQMGEQFRYVAKADASERVRVNGTAHPTVKPLALMRWLVRLVTPPGGTVLEPFAGSGTTVEACILEGFKCIAIEREADYLPLIVQRINRRRDPVQAVKAAAEDAGLFDLLEGGAA